MAVIDTCQICRAKRLMTTKSPITAIVSRKPRDRYLANLINFRLYNKMNSGYSWLLEIIDSYSKYVYVAPCYMKCMAEVIANIKMMFCLLVPL